MLLYLDNFFDKCINFHIITSWKQFLLHFSCSWFFQLWEDFEHKWISQIVSHPSHKTEGFYFLIFYNMGAFYTLDWQHVPEPTIRQKHREFIANGWISENFAIRTNPKEQVEKIIAMRAFSVGWTTIFLSRESNPNRSFITIPDLSESDIKELKIKTERNMKR